MWKAITKEHKKRGRPFSLPSFHDYSANIILNSNIAIKMELDFNRIIRVKKIRIAKSELSEEETNLSRPLLTDRGLIQEIYKIFIEILSSRDCAPCVDSVTQRKKFIFIILYLYSPSTLAGGKMKSGLREEISKVLGIQSNSTISDNCSDVVFLYQNYADFSKDITSIFSEIMERLMCTGKIKEVG